MKEAAALVLATVGRAGLSVMETTGLMLVLMARVVRSVLGGRTAWTEIPRQLHVNGWRCLPVTVASSLCVGAIVAVQGVAYVHRYSAPEVFGWAAFFAACREVGPLVMGLILGARLGANNAAQLATLSVTDRVDAMKALGVDTWAVWATPRLVAMPIAAVLLMIWADGLSLTMATLMAWFLGPVSPWTTWSSIQHYAQWQDLVQGLYRMGAYGLVAAVTSTALGLSATGGADAVGRAVTRSAVINVLAIALMHHAMTLWTTG